MEKMFRDEEIAFVYIYREPVNIAELVLQTEEVEEVQWFDLEEVYEQCGKHREIFCVPALGLGVVRRYLKALKRIRLKEKTPWSTKKRILEIREI